MHIRKFGHSCLHVVDRDGSLLIDPGTYSAGYDSGPGKVTGLTAVLITHAHADHLDVAGLARVVAANPDAVLYGDSGTAEMLRDDPAGSALAMTVVRPGDVLDVGTPVDVFGGEHAVIHADLPVVPNVGYLVGGRLCHPGDSLVAPDRDVEILALPVAAPWMALKEAVDYLRAVAPERVIPIHEQTLASTAMSYRLLSTMAPAGTEWSDIDDGAVLTV